MKNDFYFLILFPLLCLTSCEHSPDQSTTADTAIPENERIGDTSLSGKDRAILNLPIDDSSKFHFFVENPAGIIDYQRFDFDQSQWKSVDYPIQQSFIGGPLHTGRLIHQKELWRDSAWFLLYGKQLERGMVLEVNPLALLEINDDPGQSVYIVIPAAEEFQQPSCNTFDEWFTVCNDHRFFIQYWIEHQFSPRYVRRIQWKPYSWPQME